MTKSQEIAAAFDSVCDHFINQAGLARALGLRPQNLTRWRVLGFPAGQAIKIERQTNGKFKAVDLPLHEGK